MIGKRKTGILKEKMRGNSEGHRSAPDWGRLASLFPATYETEYTKDRWEIGSSWRRGLEFASMRKSVQFMISQSATTND
jgi:hypothetical protein